MEQIAQAPGIPDGVAAITAGGGWLATFPVLALILMAGVLMMLGRDGRLQASVAMLGHIVALALTALLLSRVLTVGTVALALGGWPHPFGISFVADGLGAALALTASVAVLAAAVFAAREVGGNPAFFPLLALMQAGVCGAVLTGDLFNLYVWLEIVLMAAIGLVAVTGADRRLGPLPHAVAGLCGSAILLVAIALIHARVGTLNLAEMSSRIVGLGDRRPLHAILAVLVLALAFKAAAVPFAFRAVRNGRGGSGGRSAASAVAVGLSVVAGAYAILRLLVLVMPEIRAGIADALVLAAIAAMLLGALAALTRTDLHHVGGCAVVSGIGIALSGIAVGTEFGIAGAVLLTIHLTIVATGLYLAFGLVGRADDEAGGASGGPLLSVLLLALLLSIAGLPPFAGFWPRVLLAQAALVDGRLILAAAILLTGLITAIAVLSAFVGAVWAPSRARGGGGDMTTTRASRARHQLGLVPVAALAGLSLVFGLWPAPVVTVVDAATAALIDTAGYSAAIESGVP